MTESTEKYIDQVLSDKTCDNYCNYIEDLKELIDEHILENEILKKENISLKQVLINMKDENKGYRDTVDKLRATIEKYERSPE